MVMKTLQINDFQDKYLKDKGINFSKLVRSCIADLIKADVSSLYKYKCGLCGQEAFRAEAAFDDITSITDFCSLCRECHIKYQTDRKTVQDKMQEACLKKETELLESTASKIQNIKATTNNFTAETKQQTVTNTEQSSQ